MNMHPQQVRAAAAAGLELLGRRETLVPGDLRQQVAVLELIFQGLAQGQIELVSPADEPVQLTPDTDSEETLDGG